jgi:hypothetical protein
MKYQRFEELSSWQAGMKLTENFFRLTQDKAFNFKGDLRSQLQRAEAFLGKLKQVQQSHQL